MTERKRVAHPANPGRVMATICAGCGERIAMYRARTGTGSSWYHLATGQEECQEDVTLPYGQNPPTMGHSGTDTSKARAVGEAADGTAAHRQRRTLRLLEEAQYSGLTWKELAERTGWHHGQASGVLSVLNLTERVVMLEFKRQRSHVYVHPTFAIGRPEAKRKPRRTYDDGFEAGLLAAARMVRDFQTQGSTSLADLADEIELAAHVADEKGTA